MLMFLNKYSPNDFFFYKYGSYLLFVHLLYFFLFDLQPQMKDQHPSVEDSWRYPVKIYINNEFQLKSNKISIMF